VTVNGYVNEERVYPIDALKVPDPTRGPNTTLQVACPFVVVRTTPPLGALQLTVGEVLGLRSPSSSVRDTLGIGRPMLE
jgi:hypothetical protein